VFQWLNGGPVVTSGTAVNGTQQLTQDPPFTLTVKAGGTSGFTSTGELWVVGSNNGFIIQYTGKTDNAFTGCLVPGTEVTTGGLVNQSSQIQVVQATTVNGTQSLTQAPFTLNVAAGGTSGFEGVGALTVTNSDGVQVVIHYTGVNADANAFTGCTALLPAGGSATTGGLVIQGEEDSIRFIASSVLPTN
jgi:hypothetical protein